MFEYTSYAHSTNLPSNKPYNFEWLFFSNQSATISGDFPGDKQSWGSSPRSPVPSYQPWNEELHLFSICPAPLPQKEPLQKKFPTTGPEELDLSRGLPRGGNR